MDTSFQTGFEKCAFVGAAVKTLGKGIWGLGKRLVTNVSPKGVRKIAPMKALGSGFLGLEAVDLAGKTRQAVQKIKTPGSITSNSFYNKMR